jgi:cytochrome c oxidase cbb3-type subunit IV
MYKEILRGIGGIDVYPIVSLFIFVTFFTLAIVRTLRMDARSARHIAALPLDTAPMDAGPLDTASLNECEVTR